MTISPYPSHEHTSGTTFSRVALVALPPGDWEVASVLKTKAGSVVDSLSCTLQALPSPDAAGNTHAISVLGSAAQASDWPLGELMWVTRFTDASVDPVIVPAVTRVVQVSAYTTPSAVADDPLAAITDFFAPVLRGEKGEPGDGSAITVDATPTDGSSNAVSSNGVFDALAGKSDTSHNHTGTYDPAGTAASAVSAHAGATDPHGDRAFATSAASTAQSNAISTASGDATTKANAAQAAAIAASAPAAHVGAGGSAHADAVAAGSAGFMTGADKTKLDGIAAGAQVNPASTDAVPEGSTNLYHTASRVLGQVLTGLSTAAGTVVEATHTILQAIGFLQKQVSDNTSAISGKAATGAVGSSGLTMATARLLGRSTASTGAVEEITVGSGLTLSGGSLTASSPSIAPLQLTDANTVEQYNSTTAQVFRGYKTRTDASNYERWSLQSSGAYMQFISESAGTGSANIGLAITPKGTGPLTAHIPDSTSTGGNARGNYATDLQRYRGDAAQVASGAYSVAIGISCTASGQGAVALGEYNTASGEYSFASGNSAVASGQRSTAFGGTASGVYSFAVAGNASSYGAFALGFRTTTTVPGQMSWGINTNNYSQGVKIHAYISTTDATATVLKADGYSTNYLTLPNNTSWSGVVNIVARSSGGTSQANFTRLVHISRGANAASTAIIGSVQTVGTDGGTNSGSPPAGWAVSITADTTNGALNISVTGAAATNIRWTATADFSAVTYS